MRIVSFAFIVIASMFFMGCPYQGGYPIGQKSEKPIDSKFLGVWKTIAWDGNQALEISDAGNNEIFVKLLTKNIEDTEHKTTFFKGWISKFIGKEFLNLQKANSEGQPFSEEYYYFTWSVDNGELQTKNLVAPSFQENETSWVGEGDDKKDFEKSIKQHIKEEACYGEELSWSRD